MASLKTLLKQQIIRESQAYKLNALCLSEIMWPKSGDAMIAGMNFFDNSGKPNYQGRSSGIVILTSQFTRKLLVDWKPDDRMILARFWDIIIVMGVFNSQLGPNNTNCSEMMGRHGVGTCHWRNKTAKKPMKANLR